MCALGGLVPRESVHRAALTGRRPLARQSARRCESGHRGAMTRYPAADNVSMPTIAPRFLALLRGLNVGGQNVIGKDDLVRCFEELGFESVRTYIQSGNVLFRSTETRVAALTRAIEERLSEPLSNPVQAVVFTRARYRAAVAAAPDSWGRDDTRKHNALFTLRGVTVRNHRTVFRLRELLEEL